MIIPTRSIRVPLRFAAAMLVTTALSACGIGDTPPDLTQAPLYGSAITGGFTLTDENGKETRWTDFAGKYRIIYFGYAYCPDYCPTDVSRFSAGLELFAADHPDAAANIQPLFVSVDPDRDTPEKLREFTDAFDPDLIGLTGTPEQLEAAAKNFFVQFSKEEETADGAYLMEHSTVTYLFGPDGQPIATLPTDLGPKAVAAELEKWVR
ncbi:MAG: SCO family protein [Pontixanthobacter sp.]